LENILITPSEISKHPSPSVKRDQVRIAFESKIRILEQWGKDGVPDGAKIPRTHAALRRWRGPDGTIGTWSDPLIDRLTGKHPGLAKRFKDALDQIDVWLAKKTGRLGDLEAEVVRLTTDNNNLHVQNVNLLARVDQLERDFQAMKDLKVAKVPGNR
jgi:hypothetical protein